MSTTANQRAERSPRGVCRARRALVVVALGAATALALLAAGTSATASPRPAAAAAPVQVSRCGTPSAEVEDASSGPYVYADWIGCIRKSGIGFARSSDGGRTFGASVTLPGSFVTACGHCVFSSWDPAVAVSRSGAVYASFMVRKGTVSRPVVDVSTNHGASFKQLAPFPLPATTDTNGNWGDRDFIAVAPNGTIYVTWDYGPSISQLRFVCSPIGSCSFTGGDLNAVVQRSTDGGKTWSAIHPISPGYPHGGADLAPIVVQPDGTLDVVYQAFPTAPTTNDLRPGNEYFTRSTDGGATWSTPVKLGPTVGTVSLTEWWIDGDLTLDSAANLYATWDTQSSTADVGWLSYSKDGGKTWSAPVRVTAATGTAEELVEAVGVGAGIVDVGLQTPRAKQGYATYVRPFSISHGWLTPSARRVSTAFGNPKVWPGDTFGLVALSRGKRTGHGLPVAITWGSANNGSKRSEIYSVDVAP